MFVVQYILSLYTSRLKAAEKRESTVYYLIVNELNLKKKIHAHKLETVKKVFEDAGKEYKIVLTRNKGDAKTLAEEITSTGEKHTLIAMGGDGTLHDLINGFKDFENCSMGLIPLGTGNDFAECANIPTDVKKAAELIVSSEPRPIDYIQLENGLRSINIVGMGIDVDVLKRTYKGKSKRRSKYLKATIVSLVKFKSHNFTVRYDGKEEKHYGMLAMLGNGKQFGGGIKMSPNAILDDGYLELVIVDYISKIRVIGAFIKLLTGKVHKVKEAKTVLVKSAEFIPEDNDFTIQAEGELYDNYPFNAHIVEGQLKFYLPQKI